LLGFALIPTIMCLYLASNDALKPFLYCAIEHNRLARSSGQALLLLLAFIPAACLIVYQVKNTLRRRGSVAHASGEIAVGVSAFLYLPVLYNLSPKTHNQDYIPFCGLAVVVVTPWILRALDAAAQRWNRRSGTGVSQHADVFSFVFVLLVFLAAVIYRPPWNDRFTAHTEVISAVLQLTDTNDWVADVKGETVFRRRSSYYVLEMMTEERFRRGLLVDDIPERIVSTNTCVVVSPDRFPPRARQFMLDNYLDVGPVYVAGKTLTVPHTHTSEEVAFQICIEAEYAIFDPDGFVPGTLDGSPFTGRRHLQPGSHVLKPARVTDTLAVVWAPAVDCGFRPKLRREDSV
jgi:hypothetical protein